MQLSNITNEIEEFPANKRQIFPEKKIDLIFFDVDEKQEEADFIRVDDLFRDNKLGDSKEIFTFTLIPYKKDILINSHYSRIIHRSMILCSFRLNQKLLKIRIRPNYIQWDLSLDNSMKTEEIVREFRDSLELLLENLLNNKETKKFWADACFVCPSKKILTDEWISDMAVFYQEH